MFILKVQKSNGTSEESYQSALECARVSIESVLDNEELIVSISNEAITIDHVIPGQPINMLPSTCKEIIKGCFCDSSGTPYPEFIEVVLQNK